MRGHHPIEQTAYLDPERALLRSRFLELEARIITHLAAFIENTPYSRGQRILHICAVDAHPEPGQPLGALLHETAYVGGEVQQGENREEFLTLKVPSPASDVLEPFFGIIERGKRHVLPGADERRGFIRLIE